MANYQRRNNMKVQVVKGDLYLSAETEAEAFELARLTKKQIVIRKGVRENSTAVAVELNLYL